MSPGSPRSEWGRFAEGSTERRILLALEDVVGVPLRPRALQVSRANRVEVEGLDDGATIAVQLMANHGAYKPAYRNKALADMLKLVWVRSQLPTVSRAILVVTDDTRAALSGWVVVAAADLGVEVYVFAGDAVHAMADAQL